MKLEVDKKMLPMKAHYFLFNAGTAPVVPFMPTLARQLGFSSVVVGTMYTILPVIGLLAKPLFGFVADRYQKHRLLFLLAQAITAIAFFCIMFIPAIPQSDPQFDMHCHAGETRFVYCSKVDECILSDLEAHYKDTSVQCDMRCDATEQKWDYVCKNWFNLAEADCPKQSPLIEFKTSIRMGHIVKETEPDCLFLPVDHDKGVYNNKTFVMNCPSEDMYKLSCAADCQDAAFFKETFSQNSAIKNSEVTELYQFWLFFILLMISWAGMAVVVSVGDAICFELLGERYHLYGNQRLWGAVGFGVFSLLAGVLVDAMSGGGLSKNYTIVFWMTAVMIALDVFASTKLQYSSTKLSQNILKDVAKMFLSLRIVVFFGWCIQVGLCTALIWNFLFWYLEELGASHEGCNNSMKTLQGLAMGIQCFGGELPFLFLSGWILKKIGHIHAMSLVLFAFGVRFLLYSVIENPWFVLPIELLNGVTFGIFYSTMTSYVSIVAPPGTEATLQGLVGAIFEGVGVSIGSFIAGLLFEVVGGAETFRIYGFGALGCFAIHVITQLLMKKYSKESGTPEYLNPSDAIYMLNEQEYNTLS